MKIEQIYTGCLAQGAYYIESQGEVAIIDPLREVQPYIDQAKRNNASIKYVFETHFHADFVSGHIDLSQKTNAPIVYGPNAKTGFKAHIATDGEVFKLGNISIKAIHTPGHTLESTCYLLIDENAQEKALFSGDTLFIGDVGRPDLAQKSDLSMSDLAAMLYDSLRNKIMPLPNTVQVYPAHGAGSACGKNMSKETTDTLGNQKMFNYALRANMTKTEFVEEVTRGLASPPKYFPQNVMMNKQGCESIDLVMQRANQALSPIDFEMAASQTSSLLLDTRNAQVFNKGFVPNAINIGLDGQFAPWVGALIPNTKQEILLITTLGQEKETITRLARVGYDNVIGYLEGGFEAWKNTDYEIDSIVSLSAETVADMTKQNEILIIDVRKPSEFENGHIPNAKNIPLDNINELMADFPKTQTMYLHCAGGYRSMMAASILKARGYDNLAEIAGGYAALLKTELGNTMK